MQRKPFMAQACRPSSGFTLVELMVVVSILAILLAVGVPNLQVFLAKRGVSAQVESFGSALRLARSEALKRGGPVTLCMSTDQANCATAASTGWQGGWLVFVDRTNVGAVDTGDVILRAEGALTPSGGITGSVASITFQANGIALSGAMSVQFNPKLPTSSANYASSGKLVCVSRLGHMTFATGTTC